MKLLLAEDTKDLHHAEKTMLTMQGFSVDSAYDGEEAVTLLNNNGYDAIILDIMMPKRSGLEVLAEIKKRKLPTPVMLLTAKSEVDDRVTGLDAGADDYLTKPFAMKELLARVKALTRRSRNNSVKQLAFSDLSFDCDTLELSAVNTVRLSMKEAELMQLFMQETERRLSVPYLLDRLWSEEEAGEATVKLYVNYLRQKLKAVDSRATIAGDFSDGFQLME